MSAVLITGCSAAGKSTLAPVLARTGLASIDSDQDPLLARWVDAAGAVVAEEPAEPDLAWLARHSWAWDPARLDELILAAAPATLYVCGGAANELELADRFSHMFLLEIDEPTMLARLDERRDYHDWGRIGDTREYLRGFLRGYQERLRASGVIPVDARQPLDQVVDAILSRMHDDRIFLPDGLLAQERENDIAQVARALVHRPVPSVRQRDDPRARECSSLKLSLLER